MFDTGFPKALAQGDDVCSVFAVCAVGESLCFGADK